MQGCSELRYWNLFTFVSPELLQQVTAAFVFGNEGNGAILVTADDCVYSIGDGLSDCGLVPSKIEQLSGKGITDVVSGSRPHILALTASGDLYAWGHNGFCQLGNGNTNQQLAPALCSFLEKKVRAVACGSHHSLALTQDGEVFAWGCNTFGQIGSGTTTNQSSPRRLAGPLSKRPVRLVACCEAASFAVDESGDAYGWGCNASGQLGIGSSVCQSSPARIAGLAGQRLAKFACGSEHAMALTDDGCLYAWGSNSCGQLAASGRLNSATPARVLRSRGRIVDIGAVHNSSVSAAVTETGRVLAWGLCRGVAVAEPLDTPFRTVNDVFACLSSPAVTCRRMDIKSRSYQPVGDSIRLAFNDSSTSDLVFEIDGQSVYVHRSVLCIRCQHFRSMLAGDWREARQDVIAVSDFSYGVYRAFLQYLYTDCVCLPPEEAVGLLDLANCYGEMQLKLRCQQLIRQAICLDNVLHLYSAAIKYTASDLEEFCFDFAVHHLTEVVETEGFQLLDADLLRSLLRKAAAAGGFRF